MRRPRLGLEAFGNGLVKVDVRARVRRKWKSRGRNFNPNGNSGAIGRSQRWNN